MSALRRACSKAFFLLAALSTLMTGLLVAQSPAKPDWAQVETQTLDHFIALLKMNTASPPGNETSAAEYVRDVLAKEGIESKMLGKSPQRMNLVARLKGNGTLRPLLILGHTDVVGVQLDKWKVDPFSATRQDGYIRGRGAVDDKDNLTAGMMVMVLLKRLNIPLKRDVIFLAEADEESSAQYGVRWMVENHFAEIDAEFAIAEGGGGLMDNGKLVQFSIATAEKVPRPIKLIVKGTAGHGSVPRTDNAIAHLSAAVGKIAAWQPPMRLNDTTRAYFEKLATQSDPETKQRYTNLVNPQLSPAAQEYLRKNEFMHNSMLRTSISPTMIQAGFRVNVIPSEAEATLDIRALPDEDMAAFVEQLKKVVDDPQVEFDRYNREMERPAGAPSRLDTAMFLALEAAQKRVYPGTITLPNMMTGATDMSFLRAKGIQSYGVGPVSLAKDRFCCGAHSDDEKILEKELHRFVRFLFDAVTGVAAAN